MILRKIIFIFLLFLTFITGCFSAEHDSKSFSNKTSSQFLTSSKFSVKKILSESYKNQNGSVIKLSLTIDDLNENIFYLLSVGIRFVGSDRFLKLIILNNQEKKQKMLFLKGVSNQLMLSVPKAKGKDLEVVLLGNIVQLNKKRLSKKDTLYRIIHPAKYEFILLQKDISAIPVVTQQIKNLSSKDLTVQTEYLTKLNKKIKEEWLGLSVTEIQNRARKLKYQIHKDKYERSTK